MPYYVRCYMRSYIKSLQKLNNIIGVNLFLTLRYNFYTI